MTVKIKNFLDENGRLKQWPSKTAAKNMALEYIASKFEEGKIYSEKEVNEIINEWHTFGDYFILRRGMVDNKLLIRTDDGREYHKAKSEK